MEQKVVKLEVGKVLAVLLAIVVVAILAAMILQAGMFKGEIATIDTSRLSDAEVIETSKTLDTVKTVDYVTSDVSLIDDNKDSTVAVIGDTGIIATSELDQENYVVTELQDTSMAALEGDYVVHEVTQDWGAIVVADDKAAAAIGQAADVFRSNVEVQKMKLIKGQMAAVFNASATFEAQLQKAGMTRAAENVKLLLGAYEANVRKGESHYNAVAPLFAANYVSLGLDKTWATAIATWQEGVKKGVDIELMVFEKGVNMAWGDFANAANKVGAEYSLDTYAIELMKGDSQAIIGGYFNNDDQRGIVIANELPFSVAFGSLFGDRSIQVADSSVITATSEAIVFPTFSEFTSMTIP